jgi:hypothetical protein
MRAWCSGARQARGRSPRWGPRESGRSGASTTTLPAEPTRASRHARDTADRCSEATAATGSGDTTRIGNRGLPTRCTRCRAGEARPRPDVGPGVSRQRASVQRPEGHSVRKKSAGDAGPTLTYLDIAKPQVRGGEPLERRSTTHACDFPLQRLPGLAVASNPDDVLSELSGERLRHDRHPSSGTHRHHRSDVTYSCSRPEVRRGRIGRRRGSQEVWRLAGERGLRAEPPPVERYALSRWCTERQPLSSPTRTRLTAPVARITASAFGVGVGSPTCADVTPMSQASLSWACPDRSEPQIAPMKTLADLRKHRSRA